MTKERKFVPAVNLHARSTDGRKLSGRAFTCARITAKTRSAGIMCLFDP